MIALHETEQIDSVELIPVALGSGRVPDGDLLAANPLGKIPVLVLGDGRTLFDSPVIVEYLDEHHRQTKLFPSEKQARLEQLRWLALGDGLCEILLHLFRERGGMDQGQLLELAANSGLRVRSSVAWLERDAERLASLPFGIGQIAILCAIGQMDRRFPESNWRAVSPQLARWFEMTAQRPSFLATRPPDSTSASNQTFGISLYPPTSPGD